MSSSSPRRRVSSAVIIVAAAALFATGCGESTETATTAAATGPSAAASASSASTGAAAERPAVGEIVVDGLVDYPMTLTVVDMDYMDWVTVKVDHPEAGPTEYDGILLADIFSYVGVQSDATTLVLTDADGLTAEVSLSEVDGDEAILAVDEEDVMSVALPGIESEAWLEDVISRRFR
jgi:hypothetical protein